MKKILSTFGQRTGGTRTELQRRIMEIIQIIIISEDLEALEAALTDPEVDVDYEESNKDNFLTFIASVNRNRPNISSLEPPKKKKKQTGVVFANNQSSDMCARYLFSEYGETRRKRLQKHLRSTAEELKIIL